MKNLFSVVRSLSLDFQNLCKGKFGSTSTAREGKWRQENPGKTVGPVDAAVMRLFKQVDDQD